VGVDYGDGDEGADDVQEKTDLRVQIE